MADVIISPNMSLPVPVVGVDAGPDWATNINACLSQIDGHSHSAGSGVPITPSGLDINSALSFQSNDATNVRSVRFQPQSAPIGDVSDIGCIYEAGGDLYYNDSSGNQIRITQSGSVAGASGTITGLPSGTASAAFVSGQGTFVFQKSTSTGGNVDIGTLILRYGGSYPTPSGNYISLQVPSSISSGYSFTLPAALPAASNALLASNTAGVMSYINPDGSTIAVAAGVLLVPNKGITNLELGSGAAELGATATADGSGGVTYSFHNYTQVSYLTGGASGNFTVPANVSMLFVELCGGGGGGQYSATSSAGGGGGAGSYPVFRAVPVTAGATIAYAVGAAGNGGVQGGTVASAGGNTTFGTLVSKGGLPGGGGVGGVGLVGCCSGGGTGTAGQSNVLASGGAAGSGGGFTSALGGGGGAGAGNGGNGGANGVGSPTSPAANSGAGGGGGGFGQSGANGGSGYIKIWYQVV